ncbi:MAG: hypothetical protein V3U11_06820, partial [Planctomycetota bacterium]
MMISVTCDACEHEFLVSKMRAGVRVLCQACGVPVHVPKQAEQQEEAPELVGAQVADGARSVGGDARGGTGGASTMASSWSPGPASHVADKWKEPDANGMGGASRKLKPHIEDDLRRRRLFRLGLALTIAFLAPIAGAPGHALVFPQFSSFPGMNLDGLLMVLPLIAGLMLMVISKRTDPPLRGIV